MEWEFVTTNQKNQPWINLKCISASFFIYAGKSQAPVFDVFEAFINTDNIQVFANAATDYIMCLMKFVKGLGELLF